LTFKIVVSDSLQALLAVLDKKDRALFRSVMNKIVQISECDAISINHFKNLRGSMSRFKRVHVGSFVLLFRVEGDALLFESLSHHDDSYDR